MDWKMTATYLFLLFLVIQVQASASQCVNNAVYRNNCYNLRAYCKRTSTYYGWMKKNCPRTCNLCPVNGGYSRWRRYGKCSKTCGEGRGIWTRTCTNPSPSNGGRRCTGPSNQRRVCNVGPCLRPATKRPIQPPNPVNGGYSPWKYGKCSKSCGQGTRIRTRTCTNPRPANGGNTCAGPPRQTRTCNEGPCRPAQASCTDNKEYKAHCSGWKSSGYCTTDGGYHGFMKTNCKKTCGLCKTKTKTGASDECGLGSSKKHGRVIGGVDAKPNSWPWQVALNLYGEFHCGGTLIHRQWVLTATHCTFRREDQTEDMKIILGDHDKDKKEGLEVEVGISKIINHQDYSRATIANDIALIKLEKPVALKKGVSLACLPKQGVNIAVGTICWITGWGKVKHPGTSVSILQEAKMPVVSNKVCNKLNSEWGGNRITKVMVCAGYGPGSIISGCHGDSGGPFVCQNPKTKKWSVEGAVSWGSPRCEASHKYTVFARVSEFRDWIDETIKKN